MQTGTYSVQRSTCSLCGGECFGNRFGLCQNCLKEWTITGSMPVPDWLKVFAREHHANEQRKVNAEIPFTFAFPDGEYAGSYTEIRYQIIEEKFHKVRRKGRPRGYRKVI